MFNSFIFFLIFIQDKKTFISLFYFMNINLASLFYFNELLSNECPAIFVKYLH